MRILYVDGNHLASRARHTQASLRDSHDRRTGVIYGVLRSISWIRRELFLDTKQVIAVWDGGRCEARQAIYPEYKQRKQASYDEEKQQEFNEYLTQLQEARRGLSYLGIRNVRVSGMEADDAIAYLVTKTHSQRPVIYTGDRDFHQLANYADIYDPNPKRDGLLDRNEILKLNKVTSPSDILLIKCMTGDKSDNISGIGYVGPKYAAKALPLVKYWLEHGPGEQHPDESVTSSVSDKLRGRVLKGWETLKRNQKLMQLPPPQDFYSPTQYAEVIKQAAIRPEEDEIEYVRFLKQWELFSLLDGR